MKRLPVWLLGLWLALPLQAEEFYFLAGGDVPYSAFGEQVFTGLLQQAAQQRPLFVAHVGDIKAGDSRCSDQVLSHIRDLFQRQPFPVLYTPGDNEWTDCHRAKAGGFDPLERLSRLRQLFYADASVLRLGQLKARAPNPAYPENQLFVHRGVLFVTLHMVGSHNNRSSEDGAAMAEFQSRNRAGADLLRQAFRQARTQKLLGIVIFFHADPGFERPKPAKGYRLLLETLRKEVSAWQRPVLAIHGDSHRYQLDQPLLDQPGGRPFSHFTRLEVPGAPFVQLMRVGIDPQDPALFRIAPFEGEPEQDPGWDKAEQRQ